MKFPNILYFVFFALAACNESTSVEVEENQPEIVENLTTAEKIKRQVESQLSIPANETYSIEMHKDQFDQDGIQDAVILVNREQFAHNEAKRRGRYEKESNLGFTGNYNFLFYYDGATEKVSRPIQISSSAFSPLKINIANIQSNSFKDFTLDYRIMENCYRNFYTIFRGVPKLVFQWKIFELENPKKESAYFIEYAPGTYSSAKDILVYKGKLETPKPNDLLTDFSYSITKDETLEHLFFFNPNEGKYFTKND